MLWLGYCGQPRRILDYPSSLGGWHSISSAGHLITVAAVLSFFIMIYDSVRQAKPTIRNNFGVTRFNTRLNFYFFEISRLSFIQQKNFYNFRLKSPYSNSLRNNTLQVSDLDTTLFSYQFLK
jgi:heme/copper-type cytochrome/quinol oxidase subunit 1